MANYPTDFEGPGALYAPAESGLFLGLEPLALVLLALIVLALAWAAYVAGGGGRRRPGEPREIAENLYRDIARAARDAAAAPRDEVPGAARRLSDTLERRLGAVATLGGGAGRKAWTGLDEALAGKRPKGDRPEPSPPRPHPHDHDRRREPEIAHAQVAIYRPEKVVVRGDVLEAETKPVEPHPHPPAPPHGDDKPAPYTPDEQVAALREAIDAVADHWADRARRMAEIRAAQKALLGSAAEPRPSR